uniref:Uncharacterized protein n=2 Tax=Cajanus cajan TaxID=3821 RepID=A0A151TK02_CAJCA|nr:hypothetical protein KK1_013712 [Cajanus cajan]
MKATPCMEGNRVSSVSSSSLESKSEETNANTDANDSNQRTFYKEREHLAISNNTQKERLTISNNQKKDFHNRIDVMQQKLDFISNHNKDLEREREVLQCLVRTENVGENLSKNELNENNVLKEECFLARIKDLELEVEIRCKNQSVLEDRNNKLEKAMAQREEEISRLWRERVSFKEEAFIHAKALTTEVEKLRVELELQIERNQKEYSESLAKMENLNAKLETRVADQEEMIKKLTETTEQINAENKQAKSWSSKVELCQQSSERKMEDLAEKFQKIMEDNNRVLNQRIHVVKQLNNENKESHKMTKRYEEDKKKLGERIESLPIEVNLKGLELGALNLAVGKLEERKDHVLGLVSKMLGEVEFAKDWVREGKNETKELKDKVDWLTMLLDEKKEQEKLLRKNVWKLEAKLSKEGGEKLNLMKVVKQLERKVSKLEKILRDKDEELVSIAEKKREAIRQLCFLIEFHRNRFVYLKESMSKRGVNDKK